MSYRAVILTGLPVEYLAVRRYLTDIQEEISPTGTIYEIGTFVAGEKVWKVTIVETGTGNATAALEAEKAITRYNPEILLFVGVAAGIKDVKVGDVVVASNVYNYESGRDAEVFKPRPSLVRSTANLVQTASIESSKTNWLQRLAVKPSSPPHVHIAPIASGEKVIASIDSETFKVLRSSYADARAVEMEGFGFLSAAFSHPDIAALVIRGISELIDNHENASVEPLESGPDRFEKAANHASAFAFEVLSGFQDIYLDAVLSNTEFHRTFSDELSSLRKLNNIVTKDSNAQKILKRQIFISAITCLETYLSDAFINTVLSDKKHLKSFFLSFKDFKDRKLRANEIFDFYDKADEIAKKAMLDVIYHNLPKVSNMYSATFDIDFPNYSELQKDIVTRHDLVHRNGKTKNGDESLVNKIAVDEVISRIENFVGELDKKLREVEKK